MLHPIGVQLPVVVPRVVRVITGELTLVGGITPDSGDLALACTDVRVEWPVTTVAVTAIHLDITYCPACASATILIYVTHDTVTRVVINCAGIKVQTAATIIIIYNADTINVYTSSRVFVVGGRIEPNATGRSSGE